MELENPGHLPETTIQDQGYFTPEAIALAQTVDDMDDRIFKKWKVEDEEI